MPGGVAAHREFRDGWPVVVACFAAAIFAWGFAAFAPAVYLAELQRAYGWPAGLIGTGTTLAFVAGAVLLPWVGAAIERFGPRNVLSAGLILIGAGAGALSQVRAPWQLYPANLLIGCGWAGASSTAISTILSRHFDRKRGLALSLALAGASFGGFAVAPALVGLSRWNGFAAAVPELALPMLAVILLVVRLGIRSSGSGASSHSVSSAAATLPAISQRRTALRDARFWSIAGPFAFAISAQVGMMVVQVSYLLPLLGAAGTSVALMCTAAAALCGRLLMSLALDDLPQRPVSAATFAAQAAALSLMVAMPSSPPALYLGSIGFGLCMGNVVTLPSLIIQREFAPASFGLVLGLSTGIGQVAYSFSPTLLGVVRDLSGGYRATLVVCILLQIVAAVAIVAPRSGRLAKPVPRHI